MSVAARILLKIIRLYQRHLSAIMGRQCRFYPTCSSYTAEAIERFGALQGSVLGASRICRCHPWGGGGHDPVPETLAAKFFLKKTGLL
jgi:hypothetical protein